MLQLNDGVCIYVYLILVWMVFIAVNITVYMNDFIYTIYCNLYQPTPTWDPAWSHSCWNPHQPCGKDSLGEPPSLGYLDWELGRRLEIWWDMKIMNLWHWYVYIYIHIIYIYRLILNTIQCVYLEILSAVLYISTTICRSGSFAMWNEYIRCVFLALNGEILEWYMMTQLKLKGDFQVG
jgi:hypothetical protein